MQQEQQSPRDASPLVSSQHTRSAVHLSELAVLKIRDLLQEQRRNPAEYGLRVGLIPGGCSGFLYFLTVDKPRDDDSLFDTHGIRAIVDNVSLSWVQGTIIDYEEDGSGSSFRVRSPNFFLRGPCQCGSIFNG
jgi:iron-sulfur cluster assembly accessory protein